MDQTCGLPLEKLTVTWGCARSTVPCSPRRDSKSAVRPLLVILAHESDPWFIIHNIIYIYIYMYIIIYIYYIIIYPIFHPINLSGDIPYQKFTYLYNQLHVTNCPGTFFCFAGQRRCLRTDRFAGGFGFGGPNPAGVVCQHANKMPYPLVN